MDADATPRDPGRLESGLLTAAQAGDEQAFRQLADLHRPRLQAHCYRMLGCLQDSEDAFQDTLLRARRALDGLGDAAYFATWLYRIATNVCLTALGKRSRRVLPVDLGPPVDVAIERESTPLGDVTWIGPYPDAALELASGYADPSARYEQRESIELAFIAALQRIPARQRAALILSEVLGFRAAEIADMLETTVPAVSSALQRARATLEQAGPSESQQAAARTLGDRRLKDLVERFATALEEGDCEAILELLTDDAEFEMPPYPDWARGRAAIAESWLMPTRTPLDLRALPTRLNGQPALAVYRLDRSVERYLPAVLDVLTLRGEKIARIVAFRSIESFTRFGLPDSLPAS